MDNTPPQSQSPTWLVPLLIACLSAGLSIGYSSYAGRLSLPLLFDDISYLNDGIDRLEAFRQNGIKGLLLSLWNTPPHAPLLSLQAFLGLLLSGGNSAITVYALSALWMSGFLILVEKWARHHGLSTSTSRLLLIFIALTPIFTTASTVFRPDLLAALAAVVTIGIATTCDWKKTTTPWLFALSASIAVLAKPTIFPQMGMLIGWILMIILVKHRNEAHVTLTKNPVLVSAALTILFILPYAAIGGKSIVNYIISNNFGALKEVWSFKGALGEHLGFYINGPASWLMGRHLGWVWITIAFCGFAWHIKNRDWNSLLLWGGALVIAYIIPTVNWHKNTYLGTVFQGLLIAYCIHFLVHIEITIPEKVKIAFLSLCVATIALMTRVRGETLDAQASSEHLTLVNALQREISSLALENPTIGTAMTGTINRANLRFDLWKTSMNKQPAMVADIPLTAGTKEAVSILTNNDFVITTTKTNRLMPDWIPTKALQEDITEAFAAIPEFHRSSQTNFFTIWRRDIPFENTTPISGLGPLEGPYPPHLWRVRWGLYPKTTVSISPSNEAQTLEVVASSDLQDQSLSIESNNGKIAELSFPEIGKRYSLKLKIPPLHSEITIKYTRGEESEDFKRAVLFQKFIVK